MNQLISVILIHVTVQWQMIESAFYGEPIQNTSDWNATWKYSSRRRFLSSSSNHYHTGPPFVEKCKDNPQQFIALNESKFRVNKTFQAAHYELMMVNNIFYFNEDGDQSFEFKIYAGYDKKIYEHSFDCESGFFQDDKDICSKYDSDIKYNYSTLMKSISHKTYKFTIDFHYDTDDDDNEVGINNVFIYTKPCHYSCKECSGPDQDDCTECYSGSVKSGKCVCDDKKFLQKGIGCIQECPNQNYLGDEDLYCQENKGVQSQFNSFTGNSIKSSDWQGYQDLQEKPILECYSYKQKYQIVGPFTGIEGFTYPFQNVNARVAIRLRITFTFLSLQLNSAILIFFDDILQAQIIRTKNGYDISKGTQILTYNTTCDKLDAYVARYETVLNHYNNTPVLQIFGTYLTSNEQWGFHNVSIDQILCGLYCGSCYSDVSCLTCIPGYYLHKQSCVKSCPAYSMQVGTICQDYDDDIQAGLYGTYHVKAFYDFNTSIYNLQDIIGTPTWSSTTGQYFSFYPKKIILGGPMIWYSVGGDRTIQKVFTDLPIHTKKRIMFTVIFGDDHNGSFKYKLGENSEVTLTKAGCLDDNNYVGDDEHDVFKKIDFNSTNADSSYTIIFTCSGVNNGFCAISDYYFLTYAGSITALCPTECVTCDTDNHCTECDDNSNMKLIRGQCICKPPNIKDSGTCKPCDPSCATCFGLSDTQCITCSSSRKLSNHKCICGDGYYGDNLGQCVSVCGDGVKVSTEQCDDGNNIDFDGCSSLCKLECQKQCTQCNNGICNECNTQYWQLISNMHICQPICGDGYVVEGIEECDNNQQGCNNCIFTCQDVCTQCKQGLCYDCNTIGWILNINTCIPNCGDGIIIGYEQCDDMNNIQYDGCYQCKYQCDNLCINCIDGQCYECQIGRYIQNNQCITQCGDGIYIQDYEQCDDGNLINQDGCNQYCQIEYNWQCDNYNGELSQCYNIIQPEFNIIIQTLNPTTDQIILITFTLPIKSTIDYKEINQYMTFTIEELNDVYYHTEYQFINETDITTPQNLEINLNITFLVPIEYPTLTVSFDRKLFVSEYGIKLVQSMKSKTLKTPMMLSEQQKLIATTTEKFNSAIIYSLLGVAAFCILTGSLDMFWNLMDQLQYISYLKYANVPFPENLNIFFNSFNMLTLDPILKFTRLDNIIKTIDGPDEFIINPPEKFLKDGVNAYFLSNFSSSIFCILTAYISLFAANICVKLSNNFLEPYSTTMGFRFTKFFKFCSKLSKILIKSFYYNGLLRLVMSNCYDCSFSAYIQINNYQTDGNIYTNINYFMALAVALGQAALTLAFINIAHSFHSNKTIKKQKNFDSIFDGVKHKQDFWVTQYNSVYLIKKQIFIFIIVFFYQNGAIQTLGIGINQLMFAFYMVLNKPLENNYEYYKTIVTESIIVFISTSFVIYPLREGLQMSLETYIIIGWIHIGSFCSILGFSLIIDGIQQLQKLKERFFKNNEIKTSSQTMFY